MVVWAHCVVLLCSEGWHDRSINFLLEIGQSMTKAQFETTLEKNNYLFNSRSPWWVLLCLSRTFCLSLVRRVLGSVGCSGCSVGCSASSVGCLAWSVGCSAWAERADLLRCYCFVLTAGTAAVYWLLLPTGCCCC